MDLAEAHIRTPDTGASASATLRPRSASRARACIIISPPRLLQGIAICGRCGRRMGLHYSGQNGNYPVYLCRADQRQHGGPRCQEGRALGVDAAVERLVLEALTPDRLALAIAALGELENEARALERQWSLKRERARYEAERARRQYDAVEPENRLVAGSLERVWEDKLRQAEQIDIEYEIGAASSRYRLPRRTALRLS